MRKWKGSSIMKPENMCAGIWMDFGGTLILLRHFPISSNILPDSFTSDPRQLWDYFLSSFQYLSAVFSNCLPVLQFRVFPVPFNNAFPFFTSNIFPGSFKIPPKFHPKNCTVPSNILPQFHESSFTVESFRDSIQLFPRISSVLVKTQ